jgi:hypothetical protein
MFLCRFMLAKPIGPFSDELMIAFWSHCYQPLRLITAPRITVLYNKLTLWLFTCRCCILFAVAVSPAAVPADEAEPVAGTLPAESEPVTLAPVPVPVES